MSNNNTSSQCLIDNVENISSCISPSISSCISPSICIPRVFANISTQTISDIFQKKIKIGLIKKIDTIPCGGDGKFKKIFIHFDFWYDDEKTSQLKTKFLNGNIIKVVYDNPWFWKCSLSRTN